MWTYIDGYCLNIVHTITDDNIITIEVVPNDDYEGGRQEPSCWSRTSFFFSLFLIYFYTIMFNIYVIS